MLELGVFIGSGLLVVAAGIALARHADAIAQSTPLGRWWIGALLLAAATSLPELATDLTAVRIGAVNLAAGDLFGSSMANMLIFALLALMPLARGEDRRIPVGHVLIAGMAILLNALAALFVLLRLGPGLPVDPAALALLALYVAGTRAVYRRTVTSAAATPPAMPKQSLRRPALGFLGATLTVLLAAPLFAWSARGLAAASGLGDTFFGTWLVGFSTSLPELVASIAALRIGAVDLAVGNLFGSNAFNMAIFAVLDLAQPGPFFPVLDASHALTGLAAVVLMSIGLAALVLRPRGRRGLLPWSLMMVAVYAGALWVLYRASVPA